MSSAEDVVELLGQLHQSDRSWILERLPAMAKARLAESVQRAVPEPAQPTSSHASRIAAATPAQIRMALDDEPAWLIGTVLQLRDWPWREAFIHLLPPSVRMDVVQLDRGGSVPGKAAERFLLSALAEKLGEQPAAPVVPRSAFESLLARARVKVRVR